MARRIGLTGGIAAGKSTVSAYLRQKGIPVIDADAVARQIVAPGTPALQQIKETFGWQCILPDGSLNRKLLGEKVFADPQALQRLNAITMPPILATLTAQMEQAGPLVVLDIPLLLEEEVYRNLVDTVWVVTVPEQIQLERLIARNHYSRQHALQRIRSQMSDAARREQAHAIIDNSGTVEETCRQVDQLLAAL